MKGFTQYSGKIGFAANALPDNFATIAKSPHLPPRAARVTLDLAEDSPTR